LQGGIVGYSTENKKAQQAMLASNALSLGRFADSFHNMGPFLLEARKIVCVLDHLTTKWSR
jgi:hypothetical protein